MLNLANHLLRHIGPISRRLPKVFKEQAPAFSSILPNTNSSSTRSTGLSGTPHFYGLKIMPKRAMGTSPFPLKLTYTNNNIHTNRGFVAVAEKLYSRPTVDYPIVDLLNNGERETYVVFGYSGQGPERSRQMDETGKVSGFIFFDWRGVSDNAAKSQNGLLFTLAIPLKDITKRYNEIHSTKLSNEALLSDPKRLNTFLHSQHIVSAPLSYKAGADDMQLYKPICEEMADKVVVIQSRNPKTESRESPFDRYFDELTDIICLHRPNLGKDTVRHPRFPTARVDY